VRNAKSAWIAVVDDDGGVRDAISSLLHSAGYRCATFDSAESFLASGRAREINCILLDVRMPGMSGLDLHLTLTRGNRKVPVIYVTARQDGDSRRRAFALGAAAYLPKAFDDAELLRALDAALDAADSDGHGAVSGSL
jgi:FixJ family two-component response regulator